MLAHRPRANSSRKTDPDTALSLELRYVTTDQPGISRVRRKEGFHYLMPDGQPVSADDLHRIRNLVIPPAWTDVWICLDPMGHLQAVGRDARGRRQYRYHRCWEALQEVTKFDLLLKVAGTLPLLRRRVEQDLSLPDLPREKILAVVIWLLQETLIRVGNDEYARANESFGLTTLRDAHARIDSMGIHFAFHGKSGKYHQVDVLDARIAQIVRQCQDLPGQELFQYVDRAGVRHDIASEDVNGYLHQVGGPSFTAKDFRTWMATVHALVFLQEGRKASVIKGKDRVTQCIRVVAKLLGNTPAVARKSYIHPALLERYLAGELEELIREPPVIDGLTAAERATVAFLRSLVRKGPTPG